VKRRLLNLACAYVGLGPTRPVHRTKVFPLNYDVVQSTGTRVPCVEIGYIKAPTTSCP